MTHPAPAISSCPTCGSIYQCGDPFHFGTIPALDHIHSHVERWPHLHYPEGLHRHVDPQFLVDR